MFGIGSQKSTSVVPDVEIPSQTPPIKTRSHPLHSETPEITIVPSEVVAGSSPPMEPPEVVVREVIPSSDPEYGILTVTKSLLSPIEFPSQLYCACPNITKQDVEKPVQEMSSIIICLGVVLTISITMFPETFILSTEKVYSEKSSKGVDIPLETPLMNSSTCLSPPPVNPLYSFIEKFEIPPEIALDVILLPLEALLSIKAGSSIPEALELSLIHI